MKHADERIGAMRAVWRSVGSAGGTCLKSNGADFPRERLTQDQVEGWKQQRAASLVLSRLRNADARELDLSGFAWRWEDFSNCDLRSANLSGCDLTGANFQDADLRDADLSGSDLRQSVNLNGHDFTGTHFEDANIWNVDLSGCDLTGATQLLPAQLAATNLTSAKLPDALTKFEALEASAKIADSASKVFLTLLGAVAFTFLTLATAKDWQLVTNNGNSKLPVIGVDVAIRDFFCAIPIVLLALFIYFHIYLQRLWEALATLPAVFPDGRRLDERSHPWLLTDLVRRHLPRLQTQSVALSGLQSGVSMVLGYWVVPSTIFAMLLRLLFLHNWWITGSQLLMLAFGSGFGFCSLANRWKTFKNQPEKYGPMPHIFHRLSGGRGIPGGIAAGVLGLSVSLILLPGTHANLWGVDLHGAYLRGVDFHSADLIGAHLEDAHLEDAYLENANLNDADLARADLTSARLVHAHLGLAHLQHANLQNADLRSADLRNADLRHANLQKADLQGADLDGTVVSGPYELKDVKGAYRGNVVVKTDD